MTLALPLSASQVSGSLTGSHPIMLLLIYRVQQLLPLLLLLPQQSRIIFKDGVLQAAMRPPIAACQQWTAFIYVRQVPLYSPEKRAGKLLVIFSSILEEKSR